MESVENKKIDIEKIKQIMIKLYELTNGEIHPAKKSDKEDEILVNINFLILKVEKLKKEEQVKEITEEEEEDKEDLWNKEVEDLLDQYCQLVCLINPNLYIEIKELIKKKVKEYTEREEMHRIYKTKISITDKSELNLYDLSVLKLQVENLNMYSDEKYFKDPPLFIKDIKRWNKILLPLTLDTIYLYNQEEQVILDIRTELIYNI
jgi:hypothetical protein